jgi:succinyl-CoA synthetase alpha subunit
MSILLDEKTRVCVLGITGNRGRQDTAGSLAYGTNVVCGITPGKGGQQVSGLPVFDDARTAMKEVGFDGVIAHVPPGAVAGAVEAMIEVGPTWIVIGAEGVPLHQTVRFVHAARANGVRIIGPNTNGMISVGRASVGTVGSSPSDIPGRVGVLSRSGAYSRELMAAIERGGQGVSTAVAIGGDPVIGSGFADLLGLFEDDDETDAVVIYDEAGPDFETAIIEAVGSGAFTKPLIALVHGEWLNTQRPGATFGHAGTFVGEGLDANTKRRLLAVDGVRVVARTNEISAAIRELGLTDVAFTGGGLAHGP